MKRFVATICLALAVPGLAQTNPSALSLPVTQNWGTTGFTSTPPGFAAWNGLSGASVATQAAAESTVPAGDAPISSSTPSSGGTGGCYGYAVSGDARFAILTSSNTTNGVNQLAMAINTLGQTSISLTYKLINVVNNTRTVGTVCQYRIGTSGGWTTLSGAGNPYVQSGGTVGTVTPASIMLPSAAENHAVVQIRWAVWRGTEGGNSSGFAIDDISVAGSGGGVPAIVGVAVSGSSFNPGDAANVTVTLGSAPPAGTPAIINVTSGAFETSPVSVVISNPDTSGSASVTMANPGTWTALATAETGCTGSATSQAFTVYTTTPTAPVANAGPDRTVFLVGGTATTLLTNATVTDANGPTGVTYEWTPATGPGIVGWTNRTGPVSAEDSPAAASVTFSANGTYILTLTATDPDLLTGSDTVTITVSDAPPETSYDPPPGYYDPARPGGAWLTGGALKNALTGIISTHTVRSYDDARQALQLLDLDPQNSNNIILVYTGASVPKGWDGGVTWSREHQWPESLQNPGSPSMSDLFNLRPVNPSVNSSRGNDPYGIGTGYWDPNHGALDRGDCSRAMFYMATCYSYLTLVNGKPTGYQMGDLAKMLEWHFSDPVATFERRRNHLIYSSTDNPSYYQHNRNPYIDHPEFVWAIWGTTLNDSTLYFGTAQPPDGASTATVTLQVIRGASPIQNVTLNKLGTCPTTFDVSLSGDAASAAVGTGQAFIAGVQSRVIPVSLNTATAGGKSGTITIDNTDLTSAGAGQGSADGNDVITVSGTVLEHSEASFDSASDQNALTIDFFSVLVGSGTHAREFTIYDLDTVPGFTAGLTVTAVTPSGDSAQLSTDLAPFANPVPAGTGGSFTAFFDAGVVGTFQATYTVSVADEALLGSQPGTSLVLTLRGRVRASGNLGDFDGDGDVDQVDFGHLQACLGDPGTPPGEGCADADLNASNDVDATDALIFIDNMTAPL